MCKMFAVAADVPNRQARLFHEFMSDLFRACVFDGKDKDATGFYAWSGDRSCSSRESVPADEFPSIKTHWSRMEHNPALLYLCHARGAMGPTVPLLNNHPFVGDNVALMHEGWLSSHQIIAKNRGLTLNSSTDSELYMQVADQRRLPLGDRKPWTPLSCMTGLLKITHEPTALAFIDHSSKFPVISFGMNNNGGNHMFAFYYIPRFKAHVLVSTPEMMTIATEVNEMEPAELLFHPKAFTHYEMGWDGYLKTTDTQLKA